MNIITNTLRTFFYRLLRSDINQNTIIYNSNIVGLRNLGFGSAIKNSKLGGNVHASDHVGIFECVIDGEILIGRYSTINGPNTTISSRINKIKIGNFCSIAPGCVVYEINHISNRLSTYNIFRNLILTDSKKKYIWQGSLERDSESKGDIQIGHDVWIGAQSCILSGVTIGDGAIVGANSTVTKDVPPFAIVVGSPARVVKYRFNNKVIASLLEMKWWLWDDEKIRANKHLFNGPIKISEIKSAI